MSAWLGQLPAPEVPLSSRCADLSPSLVALGPAHAGSVWLPTPPAMVSESPLGGGPNGLTGRGLPALLWRRMLASTWKAADVDLTVRHGRNSACMLPEAMHLHPTQNLLGTMVEARGEQACL